MPRPVLRQKGCGVSLAASLKKRIRLKTIRQIYGIGGPMAEHQLLVGLQNVNQLSVVIGVSLHAKVSF